MSVRARDSDDLLAELLLKWEESAETRNPVDAAELCRDCPELLADLKREISRLRAVDRFMFQGTNDLSQQDPRASGAVGLRGRFPSLPGYEILEELGRGGMGVVYKARQQRLGRFVAVKTLVGSCWARPGFVARLWQEAQALSRINHPNVVQVIDVVETEHVVSIVLEYVEGQSLARRQSGAPLAPDDAVRLALTLARTISAVHEQGILHRDIKPGNVLISAAGDIKISDFGLAKETGNFDGLTVTGELLGSPGYMAPEQAEGRPREIDVRTDIYSLGATLYEMLTGRPPFVGGSIVETLDQVRKCDPVSPRLLNPRVPRDVETICLKCLEKVPSQRFTTAGDFANELQRHLSGEPIHSRPIGALARGWRWCRRRPARAGILAVVVSAAAIIVVLLGINNRNLTEYNRDLGRLNGDLATAAANAKAMQSLAEERERQTRESLYAANISQAFASEREGDLRAMLQLLEELVPRDGEPDLRSFDWWYLRRHVGIAHRLLLDVESPLYFLCYAPDGRTTAVSGKDGIVRIFDDETGAISREIPTGQIEVNGLAFSPDGREIATAGDDGTIRFWDLETGNQRLSINAHPGKAFQLVYSDGGRQIISCGNNPVIRVHDTSSGEQLRSLKGHSNDVQSLQIDGDHNTLASTGDDHTTRLWNLATGMEVHRLVTDLGVGPVAYAGDRQLIITGRVDGLLESWNLNTQQRIGWVKHLDRMEATALHPEGKLLAASDAGGSIRLWEIGEKNNFVPGSIISWHAHRGGTRALAWSRDGSALISTGNDGRVISWGLAAARNSGPRHFAGGSSEFALLHKSHWMVTSGNSLSLWDWSTGSEVAQLDLTPCDAIACSSAGRLLASVTNDSDLHLYSIPAEPGLTKSFRRIADWHAPGKLNNLRFSPDGRLLAAICWSAGDALHGAEDSSWLLSLPQFEKIERIPLPSVNRVAFAPDSRHVALHTLVGVALWDIEQRDLKWEVPQADVDQLVFSPDGKLLFSQCDLRNVMIRNASDGSPRFQLTGHRSNITSLAISPDGRTLASAANNGVIKLSHVPTGRELFDIHHAGIDGVILEFSDDGRHLIARTHTHSPDSPREFLVFDTDEPGESR